MSEEVRRATPPFPATIAKTLGQAEQKTLHAA